MSECNLFINKWFKDAQDMLDGFKKKGKSNIVAAKFTLTSNDSEGLVTYASSPGIDSLLESVLWYSSETDGPNTRGIFSSRDIGKVGPNIVPTISLLFSNRRKGRLVVAPSSWGPSDKRQPFDGEFPSRLHLDVSINSRGEILINGTTPRILARKTASKPKKRN